MKEKEKQKEKAAEAEELPAFSLKDLIATAVACVKESNPADLEQRINFFKLIRDELKTRQESPFLRETRQEKSRLDKTNQERVKVLDTDDDLTTEDLDSIDEDALLQIQYGFEDEEFHARNFYRQGSIDYIKMFYGDTGKVPPQFVSEDLYAVASAISTEAETILTEEAQGAFMKIQYSAAAGAQTEVNFRERNKFDTWIKFNPALFNLFQAMYAVTREVNYARVG